MTKFGSTWKLANMEGTRLEPNENEIVRILRDCQRIAVVGWSPDPHRPSHSVSDYLHDHGYTILPVNPHCEGMAAYGTHVVANMTQLADVDMVDAFRRSEFVGQLVDEAIALGAPVFWMQLGVRDGDAAGRLRAVGITVVENRCTAADHARFGLAR